MIRSLVITAILAIPALVAADPSTKLSDSDTAVLAHQHAVNSLEITMGKLAQTKGSAKAVRDYGVTLVKDHTSADKDALALAKKRGLAKLPADEPKTDADRADKKANDDMMAHMKTLKGAAFDDEFLSMMVTGHDKELAKVDTALTSVADPDLITLLRAVKPVMQKHSDDAKALQHDATKTKS